MAIRYTIAQLSQIQVALASALLFAFARGVTFAASNGDASPTLSWSSELSITIDAGNGSAIIKGAALVSPDLKSWALGIVVGTNNTDGLIPVTFGIFKATDPKSPVPTWKWQPVTSTDIASATVSFSPGEELQLLVQWRNGTSDGNDVAWTTDTGGGAEAVALTNTGILLLLDADNKTISQYPPPSPSSTPDTLSSCPSDICFYPPPPPPPPLKLPPRSAASSSSPSLHLLLWFFFLIALSHFPSFQRST
ncbi:hypothetical protein KP509_31G047200 [Ceratopteris richardii]|uniref:Uncharacterized protein n=1 Tax=Ceratopteris richardii TaxID=49495 RepID=A0A8T2QZI5_CERRI|nr:hypothetical protein KP509_31G047200 [Ceratopteris richardii]